MRRPNWRVLRSHQQVVNPPVQRQKPEFQERLSSAPLDLQRAMLDLEPEPTHSVAFRGCRIVYNGYLIKMDWSRETKSEHLVVKRSLRVLAPFWIVHAHLTGNCEGQPYEVLNLKYMHIFN